MDINDSANDSLHLWSDKYFVLITLTKEKQVVIINMR